MYRNAILNEMSVCSLSLSDMPSSVWLLYEYLSACLSAYLFACLFACLSVYSSVLAVCIVVCLFYLFTIIVLSSLINIICSAAIYKVHKHVHYV